MAQAWRALQNVYRYTFPQAENRAWNPSGASMLSRMRISGGSMVLSAKQIFSGGMRVALSKCAHRPQA